MMKKLMLSKGKAMACLILMCLFLTQSCRKENFKLTERQPNGQLIKQETINKWLETNPVAKYISLDWNKAKQAIIQGKNVVRVPTLNIDKINALNKNAMLKENLLASNGAITNTSKTGNNSNYYTQNPPEVFFIQNNGNEKLDSYLLNFVPEDKTKEFGENGLWSGKLYEWNLTGDTLRVQELIKSVVKHKYLLKFGASDSDKNINSVLKSNKLQSIGGLKDKQFSSFFGWLANLLENVIGWVGSLFGFSDYVGGYNEGGYWEGWRIMPWSDGGGSGGGGSTSGGEIVYGSYLSGYGGVPGDGGNYEPYNYIGALSSNPNVIMADYIINTFSIQNLDQQTFLYNHPEITNTVFAYAEQLGVITSEDVQFIQWTIAYLKENPNINFNDFKNQFFPTTTIIADPDADNWTDPDDEILFDPDQTVYQQYQDNQPWPTIPIIIGYDKFVPNRYIPGTVPQRVENCLKLAKEQLGKKGYTVGGYDETSSQLFQTYKEQTGVNSIRTKEGISYLINALSNNIPVLVGVDVRTGAPVANKDNSTDHFIVIVGMGTDNKGKYFQFYDSSTNYAWLGASKENKLYFDSSTGKITGKTKSQYANIINHHDFIVTQIRKSILK